MRAFRIAYDGANFHGFQRQPDVRTVEGAIFEACEQLGVELGEDEARYAAAGRTDAGVSALGQTIALRCPDWLGPSALTGRLPETVWAWAVDDVGDSFHPRHDAAEREYAYQLYVGDVDLEAAREVCARLVGTHDFYNLSAETGETRRSVTTMEIAADGEFGTLIVRAPGFARQQVRRMVTLIRLVGMGHRDLRFVEQVLEARDPNGAYGIEPAPARPLVLRTVRYPAVTFEIDPEVRERAVAYFRDRRIRAAGYTRVLEELASGLSIDQ